MQSIVRQGEMLVLLGRIQKIFDFFHRQNLKKVKTFFKTSVNSKNNAGVWASNSQPFLRKSVLKF
jgi:hypothetical protein